MWGMKAWSEWIVNGKGLRKSRQLDNFSFDVMERKWDVAVIQVS